MKKTIMVLSNLMLMSLAVVFGGPIAMAAVFTDGSADTDPNDDTPLDNAIQDDPNKGIEVPGGAATGSGVDKAGLAENRIEDYVSKFQSYKYPMHTDMLRLAKQVKVNTKEPSNFEVGEAILDCVTKAAISQTANSTGVNLIASGSEKLHAADYKLFVAGATIVVDGVEGGDDTGSLNGAPLVLRVTTANDTTIKVVAVNPVKVSGTLYIPAIASGSTFHIMAPALSESSVEIAPDAAYPKEKIHYLQKKVCAITWTEFFERINKKANWNVQDIKDWQLAQFRRKCTRSLLIGAGAKWTEYNAKTGTEYCYSQEGVLRQIRLGYQINGSWTVSHLVGMCKLLFGKYSTSSEMDVYVGSDALESIANINFSDHPEIKFEATVNDLKVGITAITTPFGKLNFKHEYALDDLGYTKYAVALNMSDAKRFFYTKGKTVNADHEKGEGGEVREAKSQYYIQDDCLAIVGYNSMLIGPDVASAGFDNIVITVTHHTASDSFPTSPVTGGIYYFTVDCTVSGVTVKKGLYKYNGSSYDPYEGVING